eukprot:TRINITY_DN60167_c0_g1_i1.p2 TRINITY_DN60167_c0_g1~~TRINITY_DN60167_c0_g1_i1.p2  ORF type:complete len:428 (+),score=118.75 TRINITY_DN60167_c0_g1_i1:64-1284(+)
MASPFRSPGGAQSPPASERRRSLGRSRSRSLSPSKARRRPPGSPRLLHGGKLYVYDGDVFQKLTDHTLYTGTHRHRFDTTGRGRGLEGRDVAARSEGTCMTTTTAPGGAADCRGTRWRAGLREDFYRASVPPWEERVRPPAKAAPPPPRSAQVPRYEAWREEPGGEMVRDEVLTQEWQHGPDRFRFEELAMQVNRDRRAAAEARETRRDAEHSARRAQPPPGAEGAVSVWYVDEQGRRCKDDAVTQLWMLHQDKQRLAEIEQRLGIGPPADALATEDPDEEVELRWHNIQLHMAARSGGAAAGPSAGFQRWRQEQGELQRGPSRAIGPGPAVPPSASPRSAAEPTPAHSRRSSCRSLSPAGSLSAAGAAAGRPAPQYPQQQQPGPAPRTANLRINCHGPAARPGGR